ncbi:unnamed protein product, partial [Brassica rapa]
MLPIPSSAIDKGLFSALSLCISFLFLRLRTPYGATVSPSLYPSRVFVAGAVAVET